MSVSISPVGLATTALTADQLSAMITFREKLCKSVCSVMGSANNIPVTIQYTSGTPILSGSTVFVPITATINIPQFNRCGCNNNGQQITEHFDVAFQGQTALPTTTPTINSVGRVVHAQGNCMLINDSITVSIAAAAAAAD